MLPEDYKQYDPVEEMDVMAGDYPKLPVKSAMIHLRFGNIVSEVDKVNTAITFMQIMQGSILPLGCTTSTP